ncbi:MAG: tryptophanase [Bacteroidia bacterium]|nr:tryptophanase [Bacteroidia bacterium]
MSHIATFKAEPFPLEMHKARVVQKLTLLPIDERLKAIQEAGNNTFLLRNRDVFLDMLTDSGTNAMSDRQVAAMSIADDAYAGSETFYRLENALQSFFGMKYFLPAHQGRACEHILAKVFVKKDDVVPMNYHFTTTKAHIMECGGQVEECFFDKSIISAGDNPFKGDMDMDKLTKTVVKVGEKHIPFVRIELGTNLIGGQPISLRSIKEVSAFCHKKGLLLVVDASLLADNLFFIKTREAVASKMNTGDIVHAISDAADIIYFSARKLGCARGGGILTPHKDLFDRMKNLVPLYEGFLTYGGMSVREMEALTVGLEETLDLDMISQGPQFIEAFGRMLVKEGIPVITPFGGLGLHVDARAFLPQVKSEQYPAGALAAAIYIASGSRGMERGTISETRNPDGSEHAASMELVRLALPRRVFSLSHVTFMADRLAWLFKNRHLIGGLRFVEEPAVMRFFIGRLEAIGDWQEKLKAKFVEDFGPDAI